MEATCSTYEVEGHQSEQGSAGGKGEKPFMNLFFDTSAFIKRYLDEIGSAEIEKLCNSADEAAVSILLPIEVVSTFSRLKREKRLTEKQYAILKNELFSDIRDVTVISLTPAIVSAAIDGIEHSPLKTLDAVHLACALEYGPDYFVSADTQQITAAVKMGLRVKRVP
jgi:uncharacterized protein